MVMKLDMQSIFQSPIVSPHIHHNTSSFFKTPINSDEQPKEENLLKSKEEIYQRI